MKLKEALSGIIPDEKLAHLSNHFEVVGDIAILMLPRELEPFKKTIAAAIVSHRKNIYTVLNKKTKLSGMARTPQYDVLAGETTVTLHSEFGYQYRLDVTKTFFNTHLAYERIRVTDQVEPGEGILVPFCGVGPFAIPAAARGANVIGVEKNPDAFAYFVENIALNQQRDRVVPIEGDAFDVSLLPSSRFDRIIIPTPYGMDQILGVLSPLILPGGMIHFYTFANQRQVPSLIKNYQETGFSATYYRSCGNVAPGISRWVFDLEPES